MEVINQAQCATIPVTITLASLASATGRQSDAYDFGAIFPLGVTFPERVLIQLTVNFNAAPTAGLTMDVYWAASPDGVNYDGECGGADAAFVLADCARLYYVGSLVTSNDTGPQRASWVFFLPARYGVLVVYNASGQALTAVGADQVLTVTPLIGDVRC